MKKWTMMITAALLAGSMMCMPASAAEMKKYESAGIEMPDPEGLENLDGFYKAEEYGAIDLGRHVYAMGLVYGTEPEEELIAKLRDPELTDEARSALMKKVSTMDVLLATDKDLDAAKTAYEVEWKGKPLAFDKAEEIGSKDGFLFFEVPAKDEEFVSSLDQGQEKEYETVRTAARAAVKDAQFFAPVDGNKTMIGRKLEFTTTDLDGNPVSSSELFAKNRITMVNIWGTWCPNCVNEMGTLEELHKAFREKECGVLGLNYERMLEGEEALSAAKAAVEELGVSFPNAVMPLEMKKDITAYPTTYFVDSEGTVLTMPIVGARTYGYEPTMNALLEGKSEEAEAVTEEAQEAPAKEEASNASAYKVCVKNAGGPVKGVMLQLCDDTTCNMGETDENGIALFQVPEGKEYEIHVLGAPEGYKADAEVYHTGTAYGEVTIELVKE